MRSSSQNRVSDYIPSNNTPIATYLNSMSPEGQNLSGWSIGEPSSSAVQNQVAHIEHKAEHPWASPMSACVGAGPILEERPYEPASVISLNDVNVNLSNSQIPNGPLFLQSSSPDSISQNLNINAGFGGQGVDDCQIVERPLVFPGGSSQNARVPSGTSSANPLGLRNDGYVEESGGRASYTLEGRRLSRKRKAFEGNIGESSRSGSSNYFQHTEGSIWHSVPDRRNASNNLTIGVAQPEQVNPRLGLGIGGVVSQSPPAFSAVGSAESSRRNLRLRVNSSYQQDPIPTNMFAVSAFGPSNISSPHHSSRHLPLNNSLELRPPAIPESSSPQVQSFLAHVPAMRRNLHSSRWTRSSTSRPGILSSSAIASPEESSSRTVPGNISEHPMFVPASGTRNSSQTPVNWSLTGGNLDVAGNVASSSSSRIGSTSGVHPPSASNWVLHRNSPQYPRRLSEFVRRSLLSTSGPESGVQNSNTCPPVSGTSASSLGRTLSSGDQGHHLSNSRAMLLDRHLDGAMGIPYSLRTLAAASEGRSRLVSEICSVLDLLRRGEGLRFEDVMLLDQSMLFRMDDIHDRHRDMRLDVDNMSYEELLALGERIGNVNTGVSEETISSHLKQRTYASVTIDQREAEPCCICQEEYNNGDDLGILECGHEFHSGCIKQWLKHKNLCPICKKTAMSKSEKP